MTAWARWSVARGGPCGTRWLVGAMVRACVGMRGFRTVIVCWVRRQSWEHPSSEYRQRPRTDYRNGAENARVLDRSGGREHPSLPDCGDRAENVRVLDRSGGREHPSLPDSERRAENTRALSDSERGSSGDCSREHLCYSSVGTGLVLIVSRRAVLLLYHHFVARLRSGGLR